MFSILIRPFLFLFRRADWAGEGDYLPRSRNRGPHLFWGRGGDGGLSSHWQAD
jgi:hypothetical protein